MTLPAAKELGQTKVASELIHGKPASIDAAARITERTSSTVITPRWCTLVERSRASDATFDDTHPHRTACDSAARCTPCWFLMPESAMPPARRRVCHRSTSATVSRASGNRPIWSFLINRTRLCWSRAEGGAHVSRICGGRPRASAPVNTRTSHTPRRFSRIVATPATLRRGCDSLVGWRRGTNGERATIGGRSPPLRPTRCAGRRSPG